MGVSPHLQLHLEEEEGDLPPSNPSSFSSNKNTGVSNQETCLGYETRKIISRKISAVETKPTETAPKKLCLCAPTNHVGSFKCRLHRIPAPQKSTTTSMEKTLGRSHESLKPEGQSRLSRFGRVAAAAAAVGHKEEPLEPNQESTKNPK